jgi:UDP-glucose-4-epimerase GalE
MAIDRHRPVAVMHFAALSLVGVSAREPSRYFRNNVFGTVNLVDAATEAGIHAMVFSSTCAVYGIPARVPIDETLPLAPINPYGCSKRAVEDLLQASERAYGLRSVSLRYFNAAGADPDGEIGECHSPETHLIPLALQAAMRQESPLSVFGNDYPTADGTAIRDYIHVTDLAEAHVAALRYLLEGGGTTALNLGTGRGYSVHEVVAAIERVTGRPLPTSVAPRRPGDPPELVCDPAAAATVLAFEPQATRGLDDIVATAWHWACHPRWTATERPAQVRIPA